MMKTVRLAALAAVLLIVGLVARAQTPMVSATKVEFTHTQTINGQARTLDSGSTLFTADGRNRTDHFQNGFHTAELTDFRQNQHVTLNVEKGEAVVGSNSNYLSLQPSPGQRLGGVQASITTSSRSGIVLGTRTIGGLTVEGWRTVTTLAKPDGTSEVTTADVWVHVFADHQIMPILVERHFQSSNGDTSDLTATHVEAVSVPVSTFAIPSTFTVTKVP